MLQIKSNIFQREFREDTLDSLEEPKNTLKELDNIDDNSLYLIGENEQFVSKDSIYIKSKGIAKKLTVENNNIILKEA